MCRERKSVIFKPKYVIFSNFCVDIQLFLNPKNFINARFPLNFYSVIGSVQRKKPGLRLGEQGRFREQTQKKDWHIILFLNDAKMLLGREIH
jgi:hypothetical protein